MPSSSPTVVDYYENWESRIGYRFVLGSTRHFGYYKAGSRWPFPLSSAMRRMEDRLYKVLNQPSGAKVLDAGCGAGHVAIHLAKRGLNVTGIDLVPRHIARARRDVAAAGQSERVELKNMSYQNLSFPDESFDAVYTMETLVHSPDYRTALNEFYRVLKPGGRLVLTEYEHCASEGDPARRLAYVNEIACMPAFNQFTLNTINKELKAMGFENVERHDLTANVRPMILFFYLFAVIPYVLIWLLGLQRQFPNATSAKKIWGCDGYIQYTVNCGDKPRKK